MSDVEIIGTPERTVTRRKFIMGVIAAGATTSSVGYLFKGPQPLLGALAVQGSVERLITLNVNGQQRRVDVLSQETLAFTLRFCSQDLEALCATVQNLKGRHTYKSADESADDEAPR